MAEQCVTCKIRLSNNYPVPNPDNLPEMPCCVECDYSPYKIKTIKPIETKHNGYLFRSRLEARWAVLFDKLSVKYEYELEGFDLGSAGLYLPDFWLPERKGMSSTKGMWVEIKPIQLNEIEVKKCEALAQQSKQDVVSFEGVPSTAGTICNCYVGVNLVNPLTGDLVETLCFNTHPLCYYLGVSIPQLSKAVTSARSARFEHGSR